MYPRTATSSAAHPYRSHHTNTLTHLKCAVVGSTSSFTYNECRQPTMRSLPLKVACHSSGMTAKIKKKNDTPHSDYLPHWFLTFKCHGNFGLRTTDWRSGAQLYTLALMICLYVIHFLCVGVCVKIIKKPNYIQAPVSSSSLVHHTGTSATAWSEWKQAYWHSKFLYPVHVRK